MRSLFVILFSLSFFAIGQNNEDAELWTGVSLRYDVNKALKIGYDTQVRMDRNMINFSQYYNELQAEYELTSDLDVGVAYRLSLKDNFDYRFMENRFVVNLEYAIKAKKLGLRLKTRGRYQNAFNRLTVINDQVQPDIEQTLRLKFNLQYENDLFKRIIPFIEYELFKPIYEGISTSFIEAYRIAGGIKLDLPKKHAFEFAYIYDHTVPEAFSRHIYAVQYKYEITNKLFKK